MSLVINTNVAANSIQRNLSANQANLQKSLARLSSGSKLNEPKDDVGSFAVASRLTAAINRNARAQQNVQNSISFLQVQDGAISQVGKILDRMSELKTMSLDPTKNSGDIANYDTEFTQLQNQLINIEDEKFNGIGLFTAQSNLMVSTTEDSSGTSVELSRAGLFDNISKAEIMEKAIGATEYNVAATNIGDDSNDLRLTFATASGKSVTVRLDDGTNDSTKNGQTIDGAIKVINESLALGGISSVFVSESADGKLVVNASEEVNVTEATQGTTAGSTFFGNQNLENVKSTYQYNSLADYGHGDVITGTTSAGSEVSVVISATGGWTGTDKSFDEFLAENETTRLNNSTSPGTEVFQAGAQSTNYGAGEVVYNDNDGRYYLSRGVGGDYSSAASTSIAAGSDLGGTVATNEYLDLGASLPGLNASAAYDATKDYFKDDIISYDGNLYVAETSISAGAGNPLDGNAANWTKINISVAGSDNVTDTTKSLSDFNTGDFVNFIQAAATARANNGAQVARLESSLDLLKTNQNSMDSARSQIQDVDIASESTNLARQNILVQSAAAMLSQANASQNVALQLLG
jgi:flagellin-like hook-associated protein FlgL